MTIRVFSNADKLAEVEREIKQRQRVYPRLVSQGKLRQATADKQMEIMCAIAVDYRNKIKEGPLFEHAAAVRAEA